MSKEAKKIWEPNQERLESSHMYNFLNWVQEKTNHNLVNWDSLYRWSVEEINEFWTLLSQYLSIKWISEHRSRAYVAPKNNKMLGASWFKGGKLNFAENLLLNSDESIAIVDYNEDLDPYVLTRNQLYIKVSHLSNYLRLKGLKKGDRVAGIVTNNTDAVIIMLAVSACGGVWSSCSPDFGVASLVDRLEQVEAKYLFFHPGYTYKGKYFDCSEKISNCIKYLKTLKLAICCGKENLYVLNDNIIPIEYLIIKSLQYFSKVNVDLSFEKMDFSDPLYILFSSGTTGKPKGIIHSVGGTLLQHKKELMLHTDLRSRDKILFYTNCGWMMWNWMVSSLCLGATVVLYDGHPFSPSSDILWKICDKENLTVLGISPKYISECIRQKIYPGKKSKLKSLKTILSTGAPLLAEHYEWVYNKVKTDVHLISMSGGTDIISCFALGNPLIPVYVEEVQSAGLGMCISAKNVEGFDIIEEKGELVCLKPFVSMPIGFIKDPKGQRYENAYFKYQCCEGLWRHGDFVKITKRGGVIFYGRSDATLNPGGVRIGTAEIYRPLEEIKEIKDMVVAGVALSDKDVVIVLCIELKTKSSLKNDILFSKIKNTIKKSLTKRYVPRDIFVVSGVPITFNGKKAEIAVKYALEGKPVNNISALLNPWVLDEYYKLGTFLRSKEESLK
jgi:acetoacetyl-CoA synthetase